MRPFFLIIALVLLSFFSGCKSNTDSKFIDLAEKTIGISSTIFSLKSEGKEIFLEQYKTYYYANFEFISSLPITLTSTEPINNFEVSPLNYGIDGVQKENTIHFTIDKPGFIMVRINEDQRIFIFVDSPQEALTSEIVSVLDYEIDRSGTKIQTLIIQKALDEISGSGKVLEFPAGVYKTGLLSIKSNSKIHLSAGAVIMGPDDIADLQTEEYNSPRRFIMIKDAENVEITGRGIIDANGRHLRDNYGDDGRARALLILNSKNVTVDGIIIRNSGSWNTQILYSEDVVIKNIKMLNDIELSNTDGFDPDASKRVLIENCFAYCGDDNVAIKSTNTSGYLQDVEDITIRGCVFLTKKSALKVGTESRASAMKNILFENNDVIESDRGMTLYCYDGADYENIRYINNRFEQSFPDRCQCGIHFSIKKRNEDSEIGSMKQILIKDCSFSSPLPNFFELKGYDADNKIELVIENLSVSGEVCSPDNENTFFNNDFTDITYK